MRYVVGMLLGIHIAAGTAAVVIGLVTLLMGKGGANHRKAGRRFLWSMAVVIATAVGLTIIAFNPYFAGLTAASTVAIFSGWRVLRRRRPDLDPSHRATWLDWIVTIAVLSVATALLILGWTGRIGSNLPVVYALGYGTSAYALYDLYRFWRPLGFPFGPNLWIYEHLVKMIGGYFGAVAAFSGSVLVFLDPPWRQLWATTVGQTLSVILLVYYYRTMNRKTASHPRPS